MIVLASLVSLTMLTHLQAQDRAAFYYFDQGDVVFEFNKDRYQQAVTNKDGKEISFSDLNIDQILVTNVENDWTVKGWTMKKVGPSTYQLRKKIKHLDNGFDWNYKFLINQKYWAQPDPDYGLLVEPGAVLSDVYHIDYNQIDADKKANINFSLDGYREAEEVILTGSFNEWREHELSMNRTESGWELPLNLRHGRYEYKFIVDGEWMHDPANKHKLVNEHGTFNSLLDHFQEVRFFLEDNERAKKVILAGTFNNWSTNKIKMTKTNGGWEYSMKLNHGKYFYKFIVDGDWMIDPDNPLSEFDEDGNSNSVLYVE
jgi:hypothetical protein